MSDFVFIDCESVKILGRIVEIEIPNIERLMIEPSLGEMTITHPVGSVQLLATVDERARKLLRGLRVHPRIGDAVYLADPEVFGELISNATAVGSDLLLNIGTLDAGGGVSLRLQPERLFGRHCGIFGATGGGKSYTVASILEQIKTVGGKAILFDPTGEFGHLPAISRHYAFDAQERGTTLTHFPYRRMTEDDLFSLFRPSGQIQGPKLREAIRSLKLVAELNGVSNILSIYQQRLLTKLGKSRAAFYTQVNLHHSVLHQPYCDFDIGNLADQLHAECVYTNDRVNPANFGGIDQQALGYCEGLIARVQTLVHSAELACLFQTAGPSLADALDEFIANEDTDILRVSFRNVRFEHNTREILMNVIGRFLLGCARAGAFRAKPLITVLDEAHQFLGRTVGDEYANVRLEAFGLIAKEGRNYGLTCVLATQRPRDIPADVLSQLGTLIVHRLTNDEDRNAVERACGDLDRNAALFVPTLGPGEAIVIGPDLPAPVPVKIHEPVPPPDSSGPRFGEYWAARKGSRVA